MSKQLDDSIRRLMQRVVEEAPAPPEIPPFTSHERTRPSISKWAVAIAALITVAVLVGGTTLLTLPGTNEVADQQQTFPPTLPLLTTSTPTSAVLDPAIRLTEAVALSWSPASGEWSTILANTVAGEAPTKAVCSPAATPDDPGSVGQPRPSTGIWTNQATAFDSHRGAIVYIDADSKTWLFDVCTNRWRLLLPELIPTVDGTVVDHSLRERELVYDVDSDRTVGFKNASVAVFDMAANTWTIRSIPPEYSIPIPGSGSVYDPRSGLILRQLPEGGLLAYDVDTDTWYEVTTPASSGEWITLLGYAPAADLLAFTSFDANSVNLVDPRTGETAALPTSTVDFGGGFGRFYYANGEGTIVGLGRNGGVCGLLHETFQWQCYRLPAPLADTQHFDSMVFDPINDRLVLIESYCCGMNGVGLDDVWALDLETGHWIELLSPSHER